MKRHIFKKPKKMKKKKDTAFKGMCKNMTHVKNSMILQILPFKWQTEKTVTEKKTRLIRDRSTLTLRCLHITETAAQLPARTEAKEHVKMPTKQWPGVTAKLIYTPELGKMPDTKQSTPKILPQRLRHFNLDILTKVFHFSRVSISILLTRHIQHPTMFNPLCIWM